MVGCWCRASFPFASRKGRPIGGRWHMVNQARVCHSQAPHRRLCRLPTTPFGRASACCWKMPPGKLKYQFRQSRRAEVSKYKNDSLSTCCFLFLPFFSLSLSLIVSCSRLSFAFSLCPSVFAHAFSLCFSLPFSVCLALSLSLYFLSLVPFFFLFS